MISLQPNLINNKALINPSAISLNPDVILPKARAELECIEPRSVLAIVPTSLDSYSVLIYLGTGEVLGSTQRVSYVLDTLAATLDKSVMLVRRRMAKELRKRRNIPLPLTMGCVLFPIDCYLEFRDVTSPTSLGYINAARPLITDGVADFRRNFDLDFDYSGGYDYASHAKPTAKDESNTLFVLSTGQGIISRWSLPISRRHLAAARSLNLKLMLDAHQRLEREQDTAILTLTS